MPNFAILAYAACFSLSIVISAFLTSEKAKRVMRITRADDRLAVQASHIGEPLRLGGVPILAGLVFGYSIIFNSKIGYMFIASGMIPFLVGAWEDLTGKVSAKRRLLASIVASAAMIFLLKAWYIRTDIQILDALFSQVPLLSVLAVLAISSGFTHALNLIDGMNGLAVATAMTTMISLSLINFGQGNIALSHFLICLAAASLGMVIFNWPHGRIFLGDGGAYFLGHTIFWSAAVTLLTNPNVSVSSIILVMFWPIAELVMTVGRRLLTGKNIAEPDRMHFHQIVRRGIEITMDGRRQRHISNPLATLVLFPGTIIPAIAGVVFYRSQLISTIFLSIFTVLYILSYAYLKNTVAKAKVRRLMARNLRRSKQ